MSSQYDVVSLAVILGLLSLIPLIVVTTTSFLKFSVVLLTVRNAIGVQQVPPGLAIYGIALAMSVFVMAPTVQEIGKRTLAFESTAHRSRTTPLLTQAGEAFEPLKDFMLKYARPQYREMFLDSARKLWSKEYSAESKSDDTLIVIPAFVVSEIQSGFEIGFLIYIPFVVIDLLIANLLMALGMQQVSPQTITVPLKLLLFALVDGWPKLLNALALSYV
jgi:type III secretion protein R